MAPSNQSSWTVGRFRRAIYDAMRPHLPGVWFNLDDILSTINSSSQDVSSHTGFKTRKKSHQNQFLILAFQCTDFLDVLVLEHGKAIKCMVSLKVNPMGITFKFDPARDAMTFIPPAKNDPSFEDNSILNENLNILEDKFNVKFKDTSTLDGVLNSSRILYNTICKDLQVKLNADVSWKRFYDQDVAQLIRELRSLKSVSPMVSDLENGFNSQNFELSIQLLLDSMKDLDDSRDLVSHLKSRVAELENSESRKLHVSHDHSDSAEIIRLRNRIQQLESSSVIPDTEVILSVDDTTPRGIIESIRHDKGIDLLSAGNDEVRNCMTGLFRTLDSAIEKLSDDIYSSKSRFILELLQNADDNSYIAGVVPKVDIFIDLQKEFVYIVNNESGFSSADMHAICDIGGSLKGRTAGKIGYKGIGFKSVFSVCDTPTIISNGFQFQFNAKRPLGTVIPVWVESGPEPLDFSCHTGTQIYIPLNMDASLREDIIDVSNSLDRVPLFLRQLGHISLVIRLEDGSLTSKSIQIRRQDNSPSGERVFLDTTTTSGGASVTSTEEYIIFTEHVRVPVAYVPERRMSSIVSGDFLTTELVLGFPLQGSEQLPVCAFLPMETVGFKFLIQGDFELVASRQGVHKRNRWNEFLRDSIGRMLFANLRGCGELWALIGKFIPTIDEVWDPFWRPVVEDCIALIGDLECIKTESGVLRRVGEVVVKHGDLSGIWTSSELWQHAGVEYASADVDVNLIRRLGVRDLALPDVITVMEKIGGEGKDTTWANQVFRVFFRLEAKDVSNCRFLLINGLWTSISEGRVLLKSPDGYSLNNYIRVLDHDFSEEACRYLLAIGVEDDPLKFLFDVNVKSENSTIGCLESLRFLRDNVVSLKKDWVHDICIPSMSGAWKFGFMLSLDFNVGMEPHLIVSSSLATDPQWRNFLLASNVHFGLVVDSPYFVNFLSQATSGKRSIWEFLEMINMNWKTGETYYLSNSLRVILKNLRLPTTSSIETYPNYFSPRVLDIEKLGLSQLNLGVVRIDMEYMDILDNIELMRACSVFLQLDTESVPVILDCVNQSWQLIHWDVWPKFYRLFSDLNLGNAIRFVFVSGKYLPVKTLIYDGSTSIAEIIGFGVLALSYPTLEKFFLEQVGVKGSLDVGHLTKALCAIRSGKLQKSQAELLVIVEEIYSSIETLLTNRAFTKKTVLPIFSDKSGFCSISDTFINDSEEISQLFAGHIYIAHGIVSKHPLLCERFGIRFLSSSTTLVVPQELDCTSRSDLTSMYTRFLQSLLSIFGNLYSQSDRGTVQALVSNLSVYVCPRLEAVFSITVNDRVVSRRALRRFIFLKSSASLYLGELALENGISFTVLLDILPAGIVAQLSKEHVAIAIDKASHKSSPNKRGASFIDDVEDARQAAKKTNTGFITELVQYQNLQGDRLLDFMSKATFSSGPSNSHASLPHNQVSSSGKSNRSAVGGLYVDNSLPDNQAKQIGNIAETFVYCMLENMAKAKDVRFSKFNWVSGGRLSVFPNDMRNIDDSLGYDMFFEDTNNVLPTRFGHGESITWLIEVKGHINPRRTQFQLSSNEWKRSNEATLKENPDQRFLVIGVCIHPSPKVLYWLEDPAELYKSGEILLDATGYSVSGFSTQ